MIDIWDLKKGDLFRVTGCDVIFEYVKLDGMYSHCLTRTGELVYIGLCQVELVQGR